MYKDISIAVPCDSVALRKERTQIFNKRETYFYVNNDTTKTQKFNIMSSCKFYWYPLFSSSLYEYIASIRRVTVVVWISYLIILHQLQYALKYETVISDHNDDIKLDKLIKKHWWNI